MSKQHRRVAAIVIGGLALILVVIFTVYSAINFRPTTEIRLGLALYQMKPAVTNAARQQGLSGVKQLGTNDGLLMVFPSDDTWGIWMKDMKIPLDIIWLNNQKKVIYIVNDASPSLGTSTTFRPEVPAKYVLEVSAGTIKHNSIKVGDVASFNAIEAQS